MNKVNLAGLLLLFVTLGQNRSDNQILVLLNILTCRPDCEVEGCVNFGVFGGSNFYLEVS